MSLRLRQTIAGRPSRHSEQSLACLTVGDEAFIVSDLLSISIAVLIEQVYTSSSNVVLLNEQQEVIGTLRFWDALPHRLSSSSTLGEVQGVTASDGLVRHSRSSWVYIDRKIIAWSDVHVVIWKYQSGKHGKTWVVQSTLQASDAITTLDFKEGKLSQVGL